MAAVCFGVSSFVAMADNTIPDVVSAVASYRYVEDFSNTALTNGSIISSIVSYRYVDWPGDDVLQLQSSPLVSYYYQFLDAPLFTVIPTDRTPKVSETTPQTVFGPPPSPLQLETFVNPAFTTNPPFPPNLSKMTVVMTHGWNSNPNQWATNMGALLVGKLGASSPNIFAWNWSNAASSSICDPGTPESKTGDEGRALAQALLVKLGPGYSQRIHFVGHSLGTLVNASAANYLHTNGYSSQNTHMTLFDEAEVGEGVNCRLFGLKVAQLIFRIGHPLSPKIAVNNSPLPKDFAWADNYVGAFGAPHPEAANIILTNGFPGSAPSLSALEDAVVRFHAYPQRWYGNSITNPASDAALMGFRWSFEKSTLTPPPPTNTYFVQSFNGSELDLAQTNFAYVTNLLIQREQKFGSAINSTIAKVANNTLTANGQITPEVMTAGPPSGAGDLVINWIINLFTGQGGGGGFSGVLRGGRHPNEAGGSETNIPAYAWIPLVIPADASAMSFNYKIQGDWNDDSLAAALNGTNVMSIPGNQIETNVIFDSGLIDVTPYAGRTNEYFVGIFGGTSTNALLTVQNVAFYTAAPPSLEVRASGSGLKVSWPLTAQNFNLESTTNLTATNSWTPVTNVPAVVDLQNAITNPISGGARFYRLKK
jgi:pimeloyl-ACP methyl ester carboxylesterase